MFCVQESESTMTESYTSDKDPLDSASQQSESDDEPEAKRSKMSYATPGINLQVYQIPAFNIPKSLSIFPTTPTSTLPKFVNNPLNLANPLSITTNGTNGNFNPKRYSLPAKLPFQMPIAPKNIHNTSLQKVVFDSGGGIVRYKKNGEVAKKRGPPKGYKRKPKAETHAQMLQSITNGVLQQAQNLILSGLLAAAAPAHSPGKVPGMPAQMPGIPSHLPGMPVMPAMPARLTVVPRLKLHLPPGVELVELDLDPADWFPEEPYRMSFSRKKNPKWKTFPHRCEHCFKGYRVVSTLLQHAGERHGAVPKELAVPCPCCPHVSTRRKQHKKHLEGHEGRRRRIFCLYCLPPADPKEPFVKESERFPWDKFPQFWYASEESLRLHKKRKHPYSGLFSVSWQGTWGDLPPNS